MRVRRVLDGEAVVRLRQLIPSDLDSIRICVIQSPYYTPDGGLQPVRFVEGRGTGPRLGGGQGRRTRRARRPRETELPQRLERRADLRREEQRLFPRREVAAFVRLMEVGEVRVAALRPAPGGLVDLAGEDGERRRDGELLGAEVRGLVV